MKLKSIISVIFILSSINGFSQPPSEVINKIVNIINDIREDGCKCGKKRMSPVGPIVWNDQLYYTARAHASDMRNNNYFGHISKDGKDVGDRFDEMGYRWQFAGENLGEGQDSFEEVVHDWMASPSHCRMIMNPDMTEMGLAKRGKYWVQHFGTKIPKNYKRTNTRYSEGN